MDIKSLIRTIPDFPKKGIMFRDVTTLIKDGEGLVETMNQIQAAAAKMEYDVVVGPESRGFIFGVPLACMEKKGFVPVRKPGKLPGEVISQEYALEYGTDKLEMHIDALEKGQKVVIIDDLLATGGTALAIAKLVEKAGAEVAGFVFVVELVDLKGRELLKDYPVCSLVEFEGE